ncbi:hypothetical protein E0Z10_g4689 [Xylaria hypoxylon]|uniref:Uncharacterized protein n=1 Tax=Xylaria hypoxylon TaxID=37992 RepID=A0A4Z0YZV4_9PEZI|nr:hypothetical protein E0Z10_g4689 [Xylaria hypoxylon]
MEPFALSIPGYRLGLHSHKLRPRESTRRDEEARSLSPRTDSDTETQFSSTSRLPSETINPLSHSPDTLRQLAVAGLSPEDELPSRVHPKFPHKPLPTGSVRRRRKRGVTPSRSGVVSSDGETSGVESDSIVTSQRSRKPGRADRTQLSARIRHLNTMTAIMHRCLRDGDIVRAKRAFGLLVRTRDIDVRIDNLWAIGSEILIRDGEEEAMSELKKPSLPASSPPSFVDTYEDPDVAEPRDGGEGEGDTKDIPKPPQRWGSAANLAQVKVYLETLVQHHPYDLKRPHLTSAVDFWPALFGIELYNLDAEFQNALHHIHTEYGFPSSSFSSSSRPPSPEYDNYEADRMDLDDEEHDDGSSNRRRRRNSQGEEEEEEEEEEHDRHRHDATDALRTETQRGALEIAARIDGVLENAPYTTDTELLRLRAHVSLFIGDLYLPARLTERYAKGPRITQGASEAAEHRLRAHLKTPEEHVALARRRQEQERARAFFRRVVATKKGRLEEWILRFLDADEDEEHE